MSLSELHTEEARAVARPIKRLISPIFLVVFCFCAVCAYLLLEARHATSERAVEVATSVAAIIDAGILHNIETVDLSLEAVVNNLKNPEVNRLDPKLRQLLLFDRSATARQVDRILVLDAAGNVRLDSTSLEPRSRNLASSDYFQAHKNNTTAGVYVGKPTRLSASGPWAFTLSRRLSRADGSFDGVAVAILRLSYFEQLFREAVLGAEGNITLIRADGVVLMRWPYKPEYVGYNLQRTELFRHLAEDHSGHFTTKSATDGIERLFVYSQIGDLPLVISVGQTSNGIYKQWYEYTFAISFLLAFLFIVTVVLVMYLISELTRRKEAEMKLADLAAHDSLTGLSNRRHFKMVIGREWQRALRDRSPLALLMIDTDNFKTYNDVHGHQAGDKLLKTIGETILSATKRGGDIAARFGGDEFAVLLPDTTADGAKKVAEAIHGALAESCARIGIAHSGLSIGAASIVPTADERPTHLVGLADAALYRAKDLGRNRTEVAIRPAGETMLKPALSIAPASDKAA